MDKEDLDKIKEALEKEESGEDCNAMQKTIHSMGYFLAVPFERGSGI